MDKHPIDRAADVIGSQAALAAVLGVTKAAVNQWKSPGRKVPAEHCPAIERETKGAVRCEDLRPDVDWKVLRGASGRAASSPKSSDAVVERRAGTEDRRVGPPERREKPAGRRGKDLDRAAGADGVA